MPRRTVNTSVIWLSNEVIIDQKSSITFRHYEKFKYRNIVGEIGDFVLISNADSAEPDTEAGCDAARILSLYEDTTNENDPYRAKVQWYSRPEDVPKSCFSASEPIEFLNREVLEDHRPFDMDVSIETFFKKCHITLTFSRDTDIDLKTPYNYICRYRLIAVTKRKVQIEPVLEEERKALQLLSTPAKNIPKTPKTPNTLIKRMSRVSISEQKNWSVSKSDGTKLLLKRAILADKTEKESPKKVTPKATPKKDTPQNKRLTKNNIEDILSMELEENSDEDELPTLIIRQHVPTTPKRKTSVSKSTDDTPRIVLHFEEEAKTYSTTRSGRVTKNPATYLEPELSPVKRIPRVRSARNSVSSAAASPVKRTPRKSVRKMSEGSDDDFKPTPKTPKTPRTPRALRTPKATPGKTPKRRIITSQLTPVLQSRAHSIENASEFLKVNKSLPGREQQLDEILCFVRTKLLDNTSGCMYISGVPGTGKTATVCSALEILKEEPELPEFQLVEVNGMKIAEPRQAYVQIYKQLTGKTVVWEQACTLLDKRFTNPGPRRTPTVLLVDELDALCTRRQDVLYSIMEWAAHDTALLTVLAVANTMDLPERALAARVASRLGLTRLTFPPYTHTQLQTIVVTRLAGANVTPDAVQLIARKVAAVSGDARRALALCSRAIQLAGLGSTAAGLPHVQRALEEAAAGAAVRAVRAAPPAHRLMLRAVAAEVERTGSDETTLSRALATAAAIVALDGRPYKSATQIRAPTPSQALAICAQLSASRLLLLEPKPAEPRLLLNCSVDDVHYATREISV